MGIMMKNMMSGFHNFGEDDDDYQKDEEEEEEEDDVGFP